MAWLHDLLANPVWQGIAGIAQIVAAIFTIIAVRQTQRSYRLADEARRGAVAPDWFLAAVETKLPGTHIVQTGPGPHGFADDITGGTIDPASRTAWRTTVWLTNSGSGAAWAITAHFESATGHPVARNVTVAPARSFPVDPGNQTTVYFEWDRTRPPKGHLVLTTTTRYGDQVDWALHMRCFVSDNHLPQTEAQVLTPGPERRPIGLRRQG